MIVKGGNR